jgi:hypothetical protein
VPAGAEGFAGVIAIDVNPAVVPVPVRLAVCGLLPALSVTVSVPDRLPTTVGVNVTLMVHLALPSTDAAQVLVWAKSPLTATLVIVNVVGRLFVRVTEIGLLVLPTVWLVNVIAPGDKVTSAMPVPARLIV